MTKRARAEAEAEAAAAEEEEEVVDTPKQKKDKKKKKKKNKERRESKQPEEEAEEEAEEEGEEAEEKEAEVETPVRSEKKSKKKKERSNKKARLSMAAPEEQDVPRVDRGQLYVSPLSEPMASSPQLAGSLCRLVKQASGARAVRRGVKEVVKALRKDRKGLCVLAGDIYPMDVIAHLPVLCEQKDVPYIFLPSKHDLGLAAGTKRPTSVVLVTNADGSATTASGEAFPRTLFNEMMQTARDNAPRQF